LHCVLHYFERVAADSTYIYYPHSALSVVLTLDLFI